MIFNLQQTFPQPASASLHHLTCQSKPHCSVATPLFFYFQRHRGRRRSSAASNGFPGNANLFLGNTNLPDLVQQSPSPLASPEDASGAQVGGETGPPKTSNPPPPALPDPDGPVSLTPPPLLALSSDHKPRLPKPFEELLRKQQKQ